MSASPKTSSEDSKTAAAGGQPLGVVQLPRFDASRLATEFYTLEMMQAQEMTRLNMSRHSHQAWQRQTNLQQRQETLLKNEAPKVYAYLYHAVALELVDGLRSTNSRHYPAWMRRAIEGIGDHEERARAILTAAARERLTPVQFSMIAKRVFESPGWPGAFGGRPWGNIAAAIGKYHTMPTHGWLDHVFDLEHNTGTVFNKYRHHVRVDDYGLKRLLDFKRYYSEPVKMLADLAEKSSQPDSLQLDHKLSRLLIRGANLGLWQNEQRVSAVDLHDPQGARARRKIRQAREVERSKEQEAKAALAEKAKSTPPMIPSHQLSEMSKALSAPKPKPQSWDGLGELAKSLTHHEVSMGTKLSVPLRKPAGATKNVSLLQVRPNARHPAVLWGKELWSRTIVGVPRPAIGGAIKRLKRSFRPTRHQGR